MKHSALSILPHLYQICLPIVPYPSQKTSNNSQGKYTSKHGHRNVHLVTSMLCGARWFPVSANSRQRGGHLLTHTCLPSTRARPHSGPHGPSSATRWPRERRKRLLAVAQGTRYPNTVAQPRHRPSHCHRLRRQTESPALTATHPLLRDQTRPRAPRSSRPSAPRATPSRREALTSRAPTSTGYSAALLAPLMATASPRR